MCRVLWVMCDEPSVGPLSALCIRAAKLAFIARADPAQELPRVDPVVVAIVPLEVDGVLADTRSGGRTRRFLEHRQSTWLRLRGLTRQPMIGIALLIASSAGAGVTEELERVMRNVAVAPLDVDTLAAGDVHFDRLRGGNQFHGTSLNACAMCDV